MESDLNFTKETTKEKVTVIVQIADKSLTLTVGEGNQSFRWLAGVILNRAKETKLVRDEYTDNNFIITALKNAAGDLLNPNEHIFEHLAVGPNKKLVIKAELAPNFASDEWGNPILTPWQVNAYVHSESGYKWATQMDAWRERMEGQREEEEAKVSSNLLSPRLRSNLVQIGDDFTAADLETAFQLDWKHVKCSWLPDSPSAVSTMVALGDILRPRYAVICNIFAHFCGVGEVGERYGLSLLEFSHLIHCAKIVNCNIDMTSIEEAFHATSRQSVSRAGERPSTAHSQHKVMTRSQFADTLLYLASTKEDASTPITTVLTSILEVSLGTMWTKICGCYFSHTCNDPEFSTITREYERGLKLIFTERSQYDAIMGLSMSYETFHMLMSRATILATEEHDRLGRKAFSNAHLNPITNAWELDSICFTEFLESISFLAVRTIEGSSALTDAKKVRMAFNLLIEDLDHEDKKPAKLAGSSSRK